MLVQTKNSFIGLTDDTKRLKNVKSSAGLGTFFRVSGTLVFQSQVLGFLGFLLDRVFSIFSGLR